MLFDMLFTRRNEAGRIEPDRHAAAALEYVLVASLVAAGSAIGFGELAGRLSAAFVQVSASL